MSKKRGLAKKSLAKRGLAKRGLAKRGLTKRGLAKKRSCEERSCKERYLLLWSFDRFCRLEHRAQSSSFFIFIFFIVIRLMESEVRAAITVAIRRSKQVQHPSRRYVRSVPPKNRSPQNRKRQLLRTQTASCTLRLVPCAIHQLVVARFCTCGNRQLLAKMLCSSRRGKRMVSVGLG